MRMDKNLVRYRVIFLVVDLLACIIKKPAETDNPLSNSDKELHSDEKN